MGIRKYVSVMAAGLIALSGIAAVQADEAQYSGWNANLGGGMLFYEGDEEVDSSPIYQIGAGYDFNNRWTLEGNVGYLPHMNANDDHLRPEQYRLSDDTFGLRFASNLLFHLMSDPGSRFDPFVGLTGGTMYYGKEMEKDQHWNPYYGLDLGMTYYLTKGFGLRADYQVVAVGYDQQVNQQALLSLTYSWGRRAKAVEAQEDNLSSGGTKNPNLKSIYFGFDSSQLSTQAKSTLKENADYLAKVPGSKIILEGHCDERGTDEYNLALGERRARSAFEYLRSLGVTKDRMSTVSYGESKPAEAGHNEASWSKNRRVECLEMNK